MSRSFLALILVAATASALAQQVSPEQLERLRVPEPTLLTHYGPAPQQYGVLRIPRGTPPAGGFPVAMVVHGGCWTAGYATRRGTDPIAAALAARGIATWNIEYRQVGEPGGGWPGTFQDWGAALDALRPLARWHPLDLSRLVVVGHSAGAHGAAWLAARPHLAADSEVRGPDPLSVRAAIALDGPLEVAGFGGRDAQVCGRPVIAPLMGGSEGAQPLRYAQASAYQRGRTAPVTLLEAGLLTAEELARVREQPGVEVVTVRQRGHFELIAPSQPAWRQSLEAIERALGVAGP